MLCFDMALGEALRTLFIAPRPFWIAPEIQGIDHVTSVFSSPSGYASSGVILFGALALWSGRTLAWLPALACIALTSIAKLYHGGGCNDAPGALINLVRTASGGELKLQVRAAPEMIGVGDASLFRYPVLFMHGRRDFRLTPAERTRLAEYLERGGMLMADAICASKQFTTAFRREMAETLPNHSIERIPPDDPIFTTAYGGYDIRRVMLRDPETAAGAKPGSTRVRETAPQLEGIRIGDRWAVIFSPYDISCALEDHEAFGCRGYTRQDAARIGLNVLLYSLNQ